MKGYRFTFFGAITFAVFNLLVVSAPFIAAGGLGEVGHRTLIFNYPLSWFLWQFDLLDAVIDSPRVAFLAFFTVLGALMYSASGALLGCMADLYYHRLRHA